jgi:hypothetical protein
MAKQVSKPNIFWAPSLETARKIDDEDTVKSIETARHRSSGRPEQGSCRGLQALLQRPHPIPLSAGDHRNRTPVGKHRWLLFSHTRQSSASIGNNHHLGRAATIEFQAPARCDPRVRVSVAVRLESGRLESGRFARRLIVGKTCTQPVICSTGAGCETRRTRYRRVTRPRQEPWVRPETAAIMIAPSTKPTMPIAEKIKLCRPLKRSRLGSLKNSVNSLLPSIPGKSRAS